MVRAQIQFEEGQYRHLRELALEKRVSVSELVRQLVDSGLASQATTRRDPVGALLEIAGISKSGKRDLGRRHDAYLAEDFGR